MAVALKTAGVTYLYLALYISLSTAVIMYNKWILSTKYFGFPFPITLTMIHMGFSGLVAFFLVRVLKVVQPVNMSNRTYFTCVVPISAFFAASLWFGNAAYLYLSVAFIQMLKSLMPVATFLTGVLFATERLRSDIFLNMCWISGGVAMAYYGQIQMNLIGFFFQLTGMMCEALRLVLTQVLLQKRGLKLNPLTSLYYIAPCSFAFLTIPWYLIERPRLLASAAVKIDLPVFLSSGLVAFALNVSIYLVIGRTGAVTFRVAGILKDWLIISLSTAIFAESTLTTLTVTGYLIALAGVVYYNYIKATDSSVASKSPLKTSPQQEKRVPD